MYARRTEVTTSSTEITGTLVQTLAEQLNQLSSDIDGLTGLIQNPQSEEFKAAAQQFTSLISSLVEAIIEFCGEISSPRRRALPPQPG
jgi:TolA-binding protein